MRVTGVQVPVEQLSHPLLQALLQRTLQYKLMLMVHSCLCKYKSLLLIRRRHLVLLLNCVSTDRCNHRLRWLLLTMQQT